MLRLRTESFLPSRLSGVVYVLWGTFLIALTAQVAIPLEPVPISLATCGVMLVALTFERKAAIQAIAAYLGLGVLGAPVFANFRAGLPVLLGPTGGYLVGYLMAVIVMSGLKTYFRNDKFFTIALNCLIGTLVIYVFGLMWLSRFLGVDKAIATGLMPFIIPGCLKAILLGLTLKYFRVGRKRL